MNKSFRDHLILENTLMKEALVVLNKLASNAILFVIDKKGRLIGSMTDGDVRRGLIRGLKTTDIVKLFIEKDPKFICKDNYNIEEIILLREKKIKILPVVDTDHKIINIINLNIQKSYLPVDAVIMAGGLGTRLMPLTEKVPKPLLKIGNKTIIDHNIDRLKKFGIDDYWISIRYLGEQLEAHFGNGEDRNINIKYLREDEPLGTIGCVSNIKEFHNEFVLVTNSDILTDLDYEDFFLDFIKKNADMSVVTIPYSVDIPYAVIESEDNRVLSFKEKPTYTYYSNGGIYLMKKKILDKIPKESFYNSTDLMERLIEDGDKLISYPMLKYWLDIGKHEDFNKAQDDIKHLDLN